MTPTMLRDTTSAPTTAGSRPGGAAQPRERGAKAEPTQVTFLGTAPAEPAASRPITDPTASPDPAPGSLGPDAGSSTPGGATFGPGTGGSSPTDPDRPISEPPVRITFGPGPVPGTSPSVPSGILDPAPQPGTGDQGAGDVETGGSDNTSSGGGSSTTGDDGGQEDTGDARPHRRDPGTTAPRPGCGPTAGPITGPAQRRSWIGRAIAAARGARTYLVGHCPVRATAGPSARRTVRAAGTPVLERLTSLLRRWWHTGRDRASRLTDEDWRVIAILAVAAIVAFAGPIDLDAPTPGAVPDAMPAATVNAGAPSPAPAGGGMVDDPTSKGQITAATAHGLAEIRAHFGPVLRGESCWDKHAWNPKSDHPLGKACDIYTSPAGQFASGAGLDNGNQLVAWLRQNAGQLRIAYVIWQGRIWSPENGDRKYSGGGVYDPTDATGGHFDHLHVSYRN